AAWIACSLVWTKRKEPSSDPRTGLCHAAVLRIMPTGRCCQLSNLSRYSVHRSVSYGQVPVGAVPQKRNRWEEKSMHKLRLGLTLAASVTAIAAMIAIPAIQPAEAQQRKSIRWATSSVDSYGYKVAAAMAKVLEDALGGEYTVTVNPYPSTTGA